MRGRNRYLTLLAVPGLLLLGVGVVEGRADEPAGSSGKQPAGLLRITGSSTMCPVIAAIGERFRTVRPDVRIDETLVDKTGERGYLTSGTYGAMRAEAHGAEKTIKELGSDTLLARLLDVRRTEKEYIERTRDSDVAANAQALGRFNAAVAASRPTPATRPFDVVILDLTVKNGMGGEEAIRRLREMDPDIRAVVSSGYSDAAVLADYWSHGFSTCLNKPYRLGALKDCLLSLMKPGCREG